MQCLNQRKKDKNRATSQPSLFLNVDDGGIGHIRSTKANSPLPAVHSNAVRAHFNGYSLLPSYHNIQLIDIPTVLSGSSSGDTEDSNYVMARGSNKLVPADKWSGAEATGDNGTMGDLVLEDEGFYRRGREWEREGRRRNYGSTCIKNDVLTHMYT